MKPLSPTKFSAALAMAAAMAFGAVPARAQSAAPPSSDNVIDFHGEPGPGPAVLDSIGFIAFERGVGGKTVQGAPFSATVTTQHTQTLSDGNQINSNTSGLVARDSMGRTRREMTLSGIGAAVASGQTAPHVVFINDPVAGTHYVLHPDTKTAEQIVGHGHGAKGANSAESGPRSKRFDQDNVTTTSLGTQTINGVSAEGTRYTRTIPAGQIGNTKPIEIVTDRWYSSELQTVVMVKRTDPFRGDSVTQLTNIQRTEPSASLFQVPSDFAVQQGRMGRGGPRVAAPPQE
jgi:hypothetical protein